MPTWGRVSEIAKSNEVERNIDSSIITPKDLELVESLKTSYANSTPEQKKEMNNQFDKKVKDQMKNSPEFSHFLDNKDMTPDITEREEEQLRQLNLVTALEKYPNIPEVYRQAIKEMEYQPASNAEEEIDEALDQNRQSQKIDNIDGKMEW